MSIAERNQSSDADFERNPSAFVCCRIIDALLCLGLAFLHQMTGSPG